MEVYNGKIAVTFDELTSTTDGGAVISCSALKGVLRRHPEYRLSKGGGLGQVCRIDFDALREMYRRRFIAKYGDPRKLLADEALRAELDLTVDEAAKKYYANYRYELRGELVALGEDVQRQLVINASVLNRMIAIIERRGLLRVKNGGATMRQLLETAGETYEQLRDAYEHTLPTSVERLRTKINEYKRDGYPALISKKYGNSNTVVITEESGEYLIALKRSKMPVYTDSMLYTAYCLRAKQEGWKVPRSVRSLTDWLDRPENKRLWMSAAYGQVATDQAYSRKNTTILPSMRDSLWYGDGTKLNLYYKELVPGPRGGTWRVKTLQVYEVIDAYSEVFLGYSVCETENPRAQYAAYRMALITAGHRPYEVVHDNQGGHKEGDAVKFLDRLPVKVHRTTKPYSGQSKTIESVFNRFQGQYLAQDKFFTGMNITAVRKSSHVDTNFVYTNMEHLYTRAELIKAYEEYRERWNVAAHPNTGISRMEMYLTSSNPATPAITEEDMVSMLWWTTEQPVAYTDNGLTVTINGEKRKYEVHERPGVYDYDFLGRNRGRRYYVKYDPCDLSSVRLYTKSSTGDLRFERVAVPPVRIHRNIQEQLPGEQQLIRDNIKANEEAYKKREIEARTIERKYGMSLEQQGLNRPTLPGGSKKIEEEIEREVHRRTRNLRPKYERMSAGQVSKEISMMILDRSTGKKQNDDYGEDQQYRAVAKL